MSKFFTPAQYAFFVTEGVFLKKLARTKRAAFDACREAYEKAFCGVDNGQPYYTDETWDSMWIELQADYAATQAEREARKAAQAELREAEKAKRVAEREAAKAEKAAAKAAKEAMRPVAAGNATAQDHITRLPAGRYLLTSAQNNTYADPSFIKALETFAQANDCQILIGQTLYNKGAFRQPGLGENEDENGNSLWFDPALEQYLVESHIDLGGFAHFMSNANVIPTATYPTTGFEAATPPGVHTIIPATRIELRVTAALQTDQTKVIAATGTTTQRNYILRKTGAIATIAHKIGAVYVDTLAGTIRHLEQMPGCDFFYDDRVRYDVDGYSACEAVAALQLGDVHAEKMERENLEKALALIEHYKPENLVLHDVLDFSSRNHHNVKDATFIHAQMLAGNTVKSDLETLASVLDDLTSTALEANPSALVHIIESNHDLAINTWLKNADFKADPINALTYLRLMTYGYEHQAANGGKWPNMLEYAYGVIGQGRFFKTGDIQFHVTDESVMIAGTENGNHGHNGANGARGNPKAFGKMGIPISTGHTHSPSIYGDCYTAGVAAALNMVYNIGASSWAIAHVLTYENGQRQIIFA